MYKIHKLLLRMKKIRNPWQELAQEGYNCFGCAQHNPYGLKMEFYQDGDEVVSHWAPHPNFQSWLHTLHGGIQATLLDEIGMWFVSRKLQTSGVTSNLNIRYRKHVPAGEGVLLEVRARLKSQRRNLVEMEGEIRYNGEICTTAEITYFCVSPQKAREEFYFRGCVLEEEAADLPQE